LGACSSWGLAPRPCLARWPAPWPTTSECQRLAARQHDAARPLPGACA
jgi:hypothetical protein